MRVEGLRVENREREGGRERGMGGERESWVRALSSCTTRRDEAYSAYASVPGDQIDPLLKAILHTKLSTIESIRKIPQERLARSTVTSTMRRAAHPSRCARCGAGAGCSSITHQSLWAGTGVGEARAGQRHQLRGPRGLLQHHREPRAPARLGFRVQGSGFRV